ncbi:MAG: hypothetical protein R3236_01880 [Phycisphaeraceae bacterium]|nr:hypothetical protein [Phycisphaeraceae bacterium]
MRDKAFFWVDLLWGAACLGFALAIWSCVAAVIGFNVFGASGAWRYGFWGVIVVNALHFFYGWFHVDDRVKGVLPERPGLMAKYWESDRFQIRILAILTIGCSRYWKDAWENYRWRPEEKQPQ